MGKIGDVYYVVGLDTQGIPQLAKKEGAKAGDQFGKSFGSRMKANLSKLGGSKGGLMGALGIAGIGLATVALAKLTDVMGDAITAALEEEKSIAKLDAALRANVVGYDGNTDAIEKTLKARMRLGFADDEQRESLALLVAATKDYNKALKIQRVAMDLSRLKNISLQAASEALVKVEAGQFRILKSLGIQLPKNATATEALAAVEKVAAGQAEAFADTNEGKLLASQIRVGEALEKLGEKLLPLVAESTAGAASAIEDLIGFVVGAVEAMDDFEDALDGLRPPANEALGQQWRDFRENAPWPLGQKDAPDWARLGGEVEHGVDGIVDALASRKGEMTGDLGDVGEAYEDLADESTDAAKIIRRNTDGMGTSFEEYASNILGLARDTVTKAYEIIEDRAELAALAVEATELRKIIATGNATKEQKARYLEIGKQQQLLLIDLADNGVKSGKVVNTTMNQLRERLKTATGQEKKAILATIAALERLATKAEAVRVRLTKIVALVRPLGLPSGPQEFAEGGIRPAGVASWVGEKGKELSVPLTPSLIIPHDLSMALTGGGGGDTITNNVTLLDRMEVRTPRDIGAGLRMLGEQGHFGRKR